MYLHDSIIWPHVPKYGSRTRNCFARSTIQFYDEKVFSATFHVFHIVGVPRKTISKKWLAPHVPTRGGY